MKSFMYQIISSKLGQNGITTGYVNVFRIKKNTPELIGESLRYQYSNGHRQAVCEWLAENNHIPKSWLSNTKRIPWDSKKAQLHQI